VFIRNAWSILPEQVISNEAMVELLVAASPDVPKEVLQQYRGRAASITAKTGIRERRFFPRHENPLTLSLRVADVLLAGHPTVELDAVLFASTSVSGFPGVSQQIVSGLRDRLPGLGDPFTLDVTSNACTRFLNAVGLVASLMATS
jgi:3-oxoacyl-[acyl-carrier-protein] synthase III